MKVSVFLLLLEVNSDLKVKGSSSPSQYMWSLVWALHTFICFPSSQIILSKVMIKPALTMSRSSSLSSADPPSSLRVRRGPAGRPLLFCSSAGDIPDGLRMSVKLLGLSGADDKMMAFKASARLLVCGGKHKQSQDDVSKAHALLRQTRLFRLQFK